MIFIILYHMKNLILMDNKITIIDAIFWFLSTIMIKKLHQRLKFMFHSALNYFRNWKILDQIYQAVNNGLHIFFIVFF